MILRLALWCLAPVLLLAVGPATAQSTTDRFVSFNEFIQGVAAAGSAQYVGAAQNQVSDAGAFEQMRQHIVGLYRGVTVKHSYVLDGQYFDCVPIMQQPSVRQSGLKAIASPPPALPGDAADTAQTDQKADKFGNAIPCDPGTIPMFRVTLEQMSRFKNLREFFQKGPGEAGQLHSTRATASHKYAHAFQNVNNVGGSSKMSLWRPHINTSIGEVFSLSQHWYVAFPGGVTQTAETGWQNFPQFYGSQNSALFIYWTADGYNATGCYNLTCAAFVQTNNSVGLGGTFKHYSKVGGPIYQFQLGYWQYQGNWWLYFNGTPIGYYRGTQYGSGGLRNFATEIDYGGETVGTTKWPPMGSGEFAKTGANHAAYHANVVYFTNGNNTTGSPKNARLKASEPSPKCYTDQMHNNSNGSSKTYFFFGGPGGRGC